MPATKKSSFIGVKEGFLWGYVQKKGLGLLCAKVNETVMSAIGRHDDRVCLLRTRPSCLLLVGMTVVSLTTSLRERQSDSVLRDTIQS